MGRRWRWMKSNFDMRVSSNGRMAVSKTAHASSNLATRAPETKVKDSSMLDIDALPV